MRVRLLRRIFGRIWRTFWKIRDTFNPSNSFLTESATLINLARIKHLENFKVLFEHKRTLELGAGIGVFSKKLAHQSKTLTVTEGRNSLVRVLRKNLKHYMNVEVFKVDVENPEDLKNLRKREKFDSILCYGLLYHLSNPEKFLLDISPLTNNLILETVVDYSSENWISVKEHPRPNQAIHLGCRPNPNWILNELKKYFKFVYVCHEVPNYPDFLWKSISNPPTTTSRMIFVGTSDFLFSDTLLVSNTPQFPYVTSKL